MRSFFARSTKERTALWTQIDCIDALENGTDDARALKELGSFAENSQHQKKNTPLLAAIAWNRLVAARKLIHYDKEKIALNKKDCWPTCRNTPLVLAAKIRASEIIKLLIDAGALLNTQDYRGFTALHYACLLRDEESIKLLLRAGADLFLRDVFHKTPFDYYMMEITLDDLTYRYGKNEGMLQFVPDDGVNYFATKKIYFSALRWFVPHIIVNQLSSLAFDEQKMQSEFENIYELAKNYIKDRKPVESADDYMKVMFSFCQMRPAINAALSAQWQVNKHENEEENANNLLENYQFQPEHFLTRDAFFYREYKSSEKKCNLLSAHEMEEGKYYKVWYEMQEFKPSR